MKRLLTVAVILAIGIVGGFDAAGAAALGIQLGINGSAIDGDTPPNSEYTNHFGLVAGIQGELGFARDLSLSLQPSYVQKKSGILTAPSTGGGSSSELDLSFDYISLPLLVKFAKAGGRTYVSGGVTVDFLSAAKLQDKDVKSSFNSTAFGALLGFGVAFPAGRAHVTTELRFVQGISNMATGTIAQSAGALAPRLHSSGLELIVGTLLPVGKR